MIEALKILDGFCPQVDQVRASALESGFGKWLPNKGEIGSSTYEGMNFWGRHSFMLRALAESLNTAVFPNNMFFRVTNTGTEKAYTHSDRMWGTKTCIAYLSEHDEVSGTAFYRHRSTGLLSMPPFEELKDPKFAQLKIDMVEGGEAEWEQVDFVRGLYNRAVIFHAPIFHSRIPKHGIGENSVEGRMIWACHFNTLQPGGGF